MAKFVIECPACKNYVEGKTGFFSRKKLECSCGNIINVKTDKLISRQCAHCGNYVVLDQTKGEGATCPVCHEQINTMADQSKMEEFACSQCNMHLQVAKGTSRFTCPVCDCVNDVQAQIAKRKMAEEGVVSVIKYEGDNTTFVWKHPVEDFNMGSQLIVHESQEAVFFRNGEALDLFGAGRYTLETQKLPLLEKFYDLPTDSGKTFHSEVYFINQTVQMGIKWGTDSKVGLFEPNSGLHIEIGACGEFNLRVMDSRKVLLKLVGTGQGLKREQLLNAGNTGRMDSTGYIKAMVMTHVKSYLAQTIKDNAINILEIDAKLDILSDALKVRINENLREYGMVMPDFFVTRVLVPEDDPNFRRMKQQYADRYLLIREEEIRKAEAEAAAERKSVEAQTAARMKIIGAQGEAEALRIQKQAEADAYKMQAEAEAAEMKWKGYTYQQETARQIGLEAMQNGITGNGSGAAGSITGSIGDIAELGVTLGAMGGIMGMTKDVLNPVLSSAGSFGGELAATVSGNANTWDCSCGSKGITGNFCSNCGSRRPAVAKTWDCSCGNRRITGNFCSMCGSKRPEEKSTWDCSCGNQGITGNFCNMCGKQRAGYTVQGINQMAAGTPDVQGQERVVLSEGETESVPLLDSESGRQNGGKDDKSR